MVCVSTPHNPPTKARINICLPALQAGGAEKVLLMLSEQFVLEGHEVRFLLIQGRVELEVPPSIAILSLGGGPEKPFAWSTAIAFFALLRLFRERRLNERFLVSLTGTSLLLLSAKFLGRFKPHIVVREAATSASRQSKFLKLLIRWLYPKADGVIAVSNDVCSSLRKVVAQHVDIEVINNPVDSARLRAMIEFEADSKLKARDQPRYLLAVGRLVWEKGLDDLLRAYALVPLMLGSHLVIVGDGPLKQSLEKLALALGIADRVTFAGHQANPYSWMSRAEVFALPSRSEGFANVVLEAIAVGVPKLVATDCPGGPAEILQAHPGAWIVPCGDVRKLAQALRIALITPATPFCPKGLLERLSPAVVAQQYLSIMGLRPTGV